MFNSPKDACNNGIIVSTCNNEVTGILYGPSRSLTADLWVYQSQNSESNFLYAGPTAIKAVLQIKYRIVEYLNDNPQGHVHFFAHSRGCVEFRNALTLLPANLREQVSGTLIAPPKVGYIEEPSCKDVEHFHSEADWIGRWGAQGQNVKRCRRLERHPDVKSEYLDHEFASLTYRKTLDERSQKIRDKVIEQSLLSHTKKSPLVVLTRKWCAKLSG